MIPIFDGMSHKVVFRSCFPSWYKAGPENPCPLSIHEEAERRS